MDDERQFERYRLEVPVRITFLDSRRKRKTVDTYISDLSAVGVFVPSLKSVPIGQKVKIDIFLYFEGTNPPPEGAELVRLSVTGKVIRSGKSGTAISFARDYLLTSRKINNGLIETQDIDAGDTAGDCFVLMMKNYSHAS